MRGPPMFSIDVTNFALITHAVPAERVRAHLPSGYELETFGGEQGSRALVTATCFCNHDFRLAGIGVPRHTFNESTYRTYVTHKGRKGVYFFGRYLGTRLARASQRIVARDTHLAGFEVRTDARTSGYRSYICRASSPAGETSFELQAEDEPQATELFASGAEHTRSLTYRLHGFFTTSLGTQGHMPVGHPPMDAFAGRLRTGRFDLWTNLEILKEEEAAHPHSVLVVKQVPFRLYPPRPLV